ncbi:MAG: hypothetical protein J6B93_03300 [Clostridia bacterium]|nr:hypothetical protein [Clostridia bacterium]
MLRKTAALLLSILLLLSFAGCGEDKVTVQYDKEATVEKLSASTICSNENYELIWDDSVANVMLKSLKNGKIWSTVPYGYDGTSSAVRSTINISIMDTASMKWDSVRGYNEALGSGRVASEKIENGLKVTYYFDNYQIAVPVEYTLRKDSLAVSVKTSEIIEGGNYVAAAVSLSPYLCSSENKDAGAYLFVPTGSGAVMSVASNADPTRKYSGTVYGLDASKIQPEITIDPEQIYLPVFGVAKSDGNALLGIIESGSELAGIDAEAGNTRTDHSCVYPTFTLRGSDSFPTTQWIWSYQDLSYVSEERVDETITVGYYPLYDEEADYNGMAKRYRKYLTDEGKLYTNDKDSALYALSVLGGAQKKVATGGIPHKITSVLTTFGEAQSLVERVSALTGSAPMVQLIGYGNNGLDVGKIAGGYKFISKFGGEKQRKALEAYCKDKGISLYTDFDLIRFKGSGGGFSYLSDAAKSATLHVAEGHLINTPLRDYDTESTYRFLKKAQIEKAVTKLITFADKKGISGVSLNSMGNIAYSDFTDIKYGVKGSTAADTLAYINALRDAGHPVAVTSANDYAALGADAIYGAPLTNGNYDVFDGFVPFYQMVFSGTKPLYSTYINLAEDEQGALLKAVATGTRPAFAVAANYDIDLSVSSTFPLYGTLYEDNEKLIEAAVKDYADFYKAIEGAAIESFETLPSGVTVTEFEGGITVYVNHGDTAADSPVGELAARTAAWQKN